jgi:hypothetical protein
MDVTANLLRDTIIQSLAFTYDWDSGTHIANLSVRSNEGVLHTFQITGVSQRSARISRRGTLNSAASFGAPGVSICA